MFTHYRRLLRFVQPYWRLLAAAGIILTLNSLAGLALPLVISKVVDGALLEASLEMLNRVIGLLLGLFLLQAVFGFGQSYLLGWVGERVVANLREMLYAHLQNMPLRFFAGTRTGELFSRLGNDVSTIQNAVTDTLLSLLSNSDHAAGRSDHHLRHGVAVGAGDAGRGAAGRDGMIVLGRWVRRYSRQVQDALADISATAEEALAGVRIVKSFAREPYEIGRYGEGVERLFGIAIKRVRLGAILGPVIGLLAFSSIAVVLWVGSREVIAGHLTPGQLVSFLLYTMMIASPIASFTSLYAQFQRALGASERVFQLLDTAPEMQDAPDASDLPPIRGEVRFEGVCFDYGDTAETRIVLSDIDLAARPGQVVALVGASGAGKTTLVNLIPRFYDPNCGRILIDGHDIREVRLPRPAGTDRHRAAGDGVVQRQRAKQHRLRQAGRDAG